MAREAPSDRAYRLVSTALDAGFYRSTYEDVARRGLDPVRHYLDEGWREGRDPAPWFSSKAYVEQNPDIGGLEPFEHYLTRGWREGRSPTPSRHGPAHLWRAADAGTPTDWTHAPEAVPADPASVRRALMRTSDESLRPLLETEFDAEFYLDSQRDVAESGRDPLEHYLTSGWREGRDPSRTFSIQDYLELNPDVAAAGMEPLTHYVVAGKAEGRPVRHELGFRHQVIAQLVPLHTRLEESRRFAARAQVGDPAALASALAESRGDNGALHVTVSHDNYMENVGGVQLCIQREAAAIAGQGVDHLHLYPCCYWPVVRSVDDPAPVGVLWNGRDLGLFHPAAVSRVLRDRRAARPPGRLSFALHNMLGHGVADTVGMLAAAGMERGHIWLHDFTSLCAGVHLLRNDVVDCAAPPETSGACGVCVYGPFRRQHIELHEELFGDLDLTVAAPSQAAYDLWRRATTAPADQPFVVHPHAVLTPRGPAAADEGPLKVAFLGMPAPHKGWPAFRALAERFADDPRYAFMHLGSTPVRGARVPFHQVAVSADDPLAMHDLVEAQSVDVAVIWSLCRETFSFATYEAAAAGCAILTGPDSGNVAAFVAETGLGRVLPGEAELEALFESGEALELSRRHRRAQAFDLSFSSLTVDLIGPR